VQTTALVPTGYGSMASLITVLTAQLSLVLSGTPNATSLALHSPGSVLTVTLAGQLIVGGWLSTTITFCVQLPVLPEPSVTVHTTVFVPTGYEDAVVLTTVATPQLTLMLVVVRPPRLTPLAPQTP